MNNAKCIKRVGVNGDCFSPRFCSSDQFNGDEEDRTRAKPTRLVPVDGSRDKRMRSGLDEKVSEWVRNEEGTGEF